METKKTYPTSNNKKRREILLNPETKQKEKTN